MSDLVFTITDLKQYIYCPRVFYYHSCLPDIRPITTKMTLGIKAHTDEQQRAKRRSTKMYDLVDGERRFDLVCHSDTLGLTGIVDEVVIHDGHWYPVDYKKSRQAGTHFKTQLAAYALLLEATYSVEIAQGYIVLLRTRTVETVRMTRALRQKVAQAVDVMRHITTTEAAPDPPTAHRQCVQCEFRRFCNDVG